MKAPVRGCGTRVSGGIYAEVPLGPDGLPVEAFLVDPPRPVNPGQLGITPRGVTLVEERRPEGSVWHVLDWVGSDSYPNVADFVEEVRHLGASRRLPKTLDFSKLTRASRLILVHARACIVHPEGFYSHLGEMSCPQQHPEHRVLVPWAGPAPVDTRTTAVPPCCAALWWEDVEPQGDDSFDTDGGRAGRRQMPSFGYEARMRPEGCLPLHLPGVFMRLPIRNIAVIRDEDGSHEAAVAAASRSELDVHLEDS